MFEGYLSLDVRNAGGVLVTGEPQKMLKGEDRRRSSYQKELYCPICRYDSEE